MAAVTVMRVRFQEHCIVFSGDDEFLLTCSKGSFKTDAKQPEPQVRRPLNPQPLPLQRRECVQCRLLASSHGFVCVCVILTRWVSSIIAIQRTITGIITIAIFIISFNVINIASITRSHLTFKEALAQYFFASQLGLSSSSSSSRHILTKLQRANLDMAKGRWHPFRRAPLTLVKGVWVQGMYCGLGGFHGTNPDTLWIAVREHKILIYIYPYHSR